MAVLNAVYADADLYRAVVSKSDTAEDGEIVGDLKAISRYVDWKTGRFFGRDDAPTARVFVVPSLYGAAYDANYLASFEVDDIATASGLLVKDDTDANGVFGETAWAATDYELRPLNAPAGPEPAPYTRIVVPNWSTKYGYWASGQRLQVTAVWGWPAVPDAIARATCHLAAILRLETPRSTRRTSEMGETMSTSREAQAIVGDLVMPYRRRSIVFA